MSGTVVVENNTGHAIHGTDCYSPFAVALGNEKITPSVGWLLCAVPFTIPVGESSWPVTVVARYGGCGKGSDTDLPRCIDGRPPPLPPGEYRAMLYQNPHLIRTPPSISIRVTP